MTSGGKFLAEPGTYHCLVTAATESPCKRDGSPFSGALFSANVSVFAGTVAGQENKITDLIFYDPDQATGSTEEELKKKKANSQKAIDRFAVAVGIVTPQDIIAQKPYTFEMKDIVGRQLVIEFVKNKEGNGLRSWDNFHHVDDEAVKSIPKKADMLRTIPANLRWTGKSTTPQGAPASAPPAPAPAPASTVDAGTL